MNKLIRKAVVTLCGGATLVLLLTWAAYALENPPTVKAVVDEFPEVFPWLCEGFEVRSAGEKKSVWFKVIDSKKVFRSFVVGVPASEKVTLPNGSTFHRQQSELRSYVSKKLFGTQLLVDAEMVLVFDEGGQERALNDLENQIADRQPVFLLFGKNPLAAEFKNLVKKNYLLVRIQPPEGSPLVSIQPFTKPESYKGEPHIDLFGIPTHQQEGDGE